MIEKNKYWVWFASLPQISINKKKILLNIFKSPQKIWEADVLDLKGIKGLTLKNLEILKDKKYRMELDSHLKNIHKNNIQILTLEDDRYPSLLKNIYDPPIVLYVKGEIKKEEICIAIVGSRKATQYGLNVAYNMADELSKYGITIISGMARGIDTCAHKGVLKNKGRTIAVLGSGLDVIYPYENKDIFNEISQTGLVVSEYLPGTKPLPYNFPARNRIISGISEGVIVVEAGKKSGSLITADLALEQGRDVFAIPGNIDYKNSEGTNMLIKDGAKLVTNIEDVLCEIKNFRYSREKQNYYIDKTKYPELGNKEMIIIKYLANESLDMELIIKKTGLSAREVNDIMIALELRGIVRRINEKVFKLS